MNCCHAIKNIAFASGSLIRFYFGWFAAVRMSLYDFDRISKFKHHFYGPESEGCG